MSNITLPHDWTPRAYQLPFFEAMDNGIKRACLVEHRRAGKDSQVLNYTAKTMFDRIGNYWHLFPKQTQARKAIWHGVDREGRKIIDQAFPLEIRKNTLKQEMLIETANGSTWQLCGSDNYDSLVGANPVGVVFSEWPLCDPAAWDFIRPILAENDGWAVFIYTPRGKNHGYTLYNMAKKNPKWYTTKLTVDDTQRDDGTPVISPETVDDERAEGVNEEIIQQEYYCSFEAQIPGAVYGREVSAAHADGRVRQIPIEPSVEVNTFWDLGRNKSSGNMSIWFVQAVNQEIRLIAYYQNHGEGMAHYINYLREFEQMHNIRYGVHYAPHDIGVTELMSNKTRQSTAKEMGITFLKVPRIDFIQNGIEATKKLFPRFIFDDSRIMIKPQYNMIGSEFGLNAIASYQYTFNDKTQQYSDTPLHDWCSDGADALRQLGQAWVPSLSKGRRVQRRTVTIKTNINPFA